MLIVVSVIYITKHFICVQNFVATYKHLFHPEPKQEHNIQTSDPIRSPTSVTMVTQQHDTTRNRGMHN